jgi:hypothetical protein
LKVVELRFELVARSSKYHDGLSWKIGAWG